LYYQRKIDAELLKWKESAIHKPLLLRGARQVGKSSTVRHLGELFDNCVEVNFERRELSKPVNEVFIRCNTPKDICEELSALYAKPIVPGKTLLFLDEIQETPEALSSLRYFYEEMPELHVIAAGSLLEFTLQDIASYGVGRIRSLYLYPFSFDEFLRAANEQMLADRILSASPERPLPEALHSKAKHFLIRFILLGGMPEIVSSYLGGMQIPDCEALLDDILYSYYTDFAKYMARVPASRLREVWTSIMHQAGGKFVYSRAANNANFSQIKECVELLQLSGLVLPVISTSANGIPLAAEQNPKHKKLIPFDTGLFQRFLNLPFSDFMNADNLMMINKGAIAEIFAGIELIKAMPSNIPASLFYWQRENKSSNAEVDYLLQRRTAIIPLEVKAGTKGAMQSMHLFIKEKNAAYGIRSSMENFAQYDDIQVYPLYALGRI
jgi:predicted AAA+ superfamily ATPase